MSERVKITIDGREVEYSAIREQGCQRTVTLVLGEIVCSQRRYDRDALRHQLCQKVAELLDVRIRSSQRKQTFQLIVFDLPAANDVTPCGSLAGQLDGVLRFRLFLLVVAVLQSLVSDSKTSGDS